MDNILVKIALAIAIQNTTFLLTSLVSDHRLLGDDFSFI